MKRNKSDRNDARSIADVDDLAVMGERVEQCRGHPGVAEDGRPFAEGEVGSADDRGSLVEPADQVKEELAAGLGEGEIAEFVEHDEVDAGEVVGDASLLAGTVLGLQPVDQIDDVEEAAACSAADEGTGDGDGQMQLARAGAADEHGVALVGNDGAGGEVAHERLVDGRAGEVEVVDVLCQRQLGDGELVLDGARLLLGDLGRQDVTDNSRGLMLALDGGGHDLVVGASHRASVSP